MASSRSRWERRRRVRQMRILGGAFMVAAVVSLALWAITSRDTSDDGDTTVLSAQTSTTLADATTTTIDRALADAQASDDCLATWPKRSRTLQVLAFDAPVDDPDLVDTVASAGIGALFLRNAPGDNLKEAVTAWRASGGDVPPFIAVDEEGGTVQYLEPLVGDLASARSIAAEGDGAAARATYSAVATQAADLGVDLVFAPDVDTTDATAGAIGTRSYGDDPAVVVQFAQAAIDAWSNAGVLPTLKHFPGHGHVSGDSHDAPVVGPTLEELRARDLLAFEPLLADDVAVMVGHIVIPDVTGDKPASLSEEMIRGLLRYEYRFDGLVITDALSMGAIAQSYTLPEASVEALKAGNDLLLLGSNDPADVDAVAEAIETAVETGTVPENRLNEAIRRVLTAKGIDPCTSRPAAAGPESATTVPVEAIDPYGPIGTTAAP
ncbi:MAG: glycoside hydrolase family 3 protein [Actinobacteria bacterium]|nr:glycoside hydrolase family 3 protein [Actinomycetota bacterium]